MKSGSAIVVLIILVVVLAVPTLVMVGVMVGRQLAATCPACECICPESNVSSTSGGISEYVVNNDEDPPCDDADVCTWNVLTGVTNATSGCLYRQKQRGTFCNSSCFDYHEESYCNGKGACVNDDPTACLGHCPWAAFNTGGVGFLSYPTASFEDDNVLFPIKEYYWKGRLAGTASTDNKAQTEVAPYHQGTFVQVCIAGQRHEIILLPRFSSSYGSSDGSPNFVSNTGMECSDLLNHSSTTADTTCIIDTEFAIDSTVMRNMADEYWLNGGVAPEASYLNWNFTGRGCVFRYACGAYNESAFSDPAALESKKRFVADIVEEQPHLVRVGNPSFFGPMNHRDFASILYTSLGEEFAAEKERRRRRKKREATVIIS